MKVLIADAFEEQGVLSLRRLGCEVEVQPGCKDAALVEAIRASRCEVFVVRSTKVNAPMLDASPALSLVVRAGAGVNTIDVHAASQRGIYVANCPGKNAVAVAELTFGLILALDRRIVEGTVDLRAGTWNKKLYTQASGLKGRTLGIVGLGQIGRAVAARALAFEMSVLAWSRSLAKEGAAEAGVFRAESPEAVADQSEVVSIHLALAPETTQLIGARFFERMRTGAIFVNTSRAEVVDGGALRAAVSAKRLRVGLDVFETEPVSGTGSFSDPLFESRQIVYGTHHIGASTNQAQEAIAEETVRVIRVYAETGRVENCVNLCRRSPAQSMLHVRHRNRPGVLAHVLGAIRAAGVNVEEMENVIYDGAEAACAHIKIDRPLNPDVMAVIERGNEHVLGVSLAALNR